MKFLDSYGFYSCDEELLKTLGLKLFKDIPVHESVYLGEVVYNKEDDENMVKVKVTVSGHIAQFWKFEVTIIQKSSDKTRKYKIGTGSGNLTDYWNVLNPIFEKEAEGMIAIRAGLNYDI